MTIRTDVTVDPTLSPRLAEVEAPATIFSAQDQVDTLRDIEQEPRFGSEAKLINSSGKENLGGGVTVGITNQLNDVQIVFESRLTPTSSGTITTGDANGITLTDTAATFQTDGVTRGAVVINFTDLSITEVLTVDSETQITGRVLRAGTLNQYTVADVYKIWNIVQCEVAGGNTTAIDNVGADLSPIFPTAFTQIVRTSSSSATLQQLSEVQHSSFGGHVNIDVANGAAGTAYPLGSETDPVDNLADALTIDAERGFGKLGVSGAITIGATDNIDNFIVEGDGVTFNIKRTDITLASGCSTSNTTFSRCYITGTQGGETRYDGCILEDLLNSHCSYHGCGFVGTIGMPAGGFDTHTKDVVNCFTGRSAITWDLNGTNMDLRFVNFSGDITFTNGTGATCNVYLNMSGGNVTIDASCTAGNFFVTGNCIVMNNSTSAVDTEGIIMAPGAAMTESYPVDGQSAMTPEEALYFIVQAISEFKRTGTLISGKKRDGVTEAFELTLDSATAPTSSTQSG